MDSKNFLEGTFDPYIGHEIIEIKENYVKSSLEVKDYHKQPMGDGSWWGNRYHG